MTYQNRRLYVTIDVKAIPQDRPRACHRNGITWAYKTKRNKDFEKYIADQVIAAMDSEGVNMITDIPVYLSVDIKKSIPKSWTKKKAKAALNGDILPTSKPDVSNYYKLIEDALNGILYADDSQIVAQQSSKSYHDTDIISIEVSW
jgi:Holliday junction resolvase RusA-like endonuclease